MSSSLFWRPAETGGKELGCDLKFALRKRFNGPLCLGISSRAFQLGGFNVAPLSRSEQIAVRGETAADDPEACFNRLVEQFRDLLKRPSHVGLLPRPCWVAESTTAPVITVTKP